MMDSNDTQRQHSPPDGPSGASSQPTGPIRDDEPEPQRATPRSGRAYTFQPASQGGGAASKGVLGNPWFWPIVNAVGLAVVILVNGLANALPLNDITTGEVVNQDPVYFQPAGWVFSIWSVIYILLAVFVVYTLLPVGRNDARVRRIAPLFLIVNAANVLWLFAWHWEQYALAFLLLAVLLASVATIYAMLRLRRRATPADSWLKRLIVWAPFSIYFGWATIATLANLMVWWDRGQLDAGPFSFPVWAVVFMLIGTIVAAFIGLAGHDPFFPAVFLWAYVGIAAEQWDASTLVSVSAIILSVVVAAITLMSALLIYDRNALRNIWPKRDTASTPS